MSTQINPVYMIKQPDLCTVTITEPWCIAYPLDLSYHGKYYRKECAHCGFNKLRTKRTEADRTAIKVHRNTSKHCCPMCKKRFKEKEFVVNLGFYGRHVLVHISCLDLFIKKLNKFNIEELPTIKEKIALEEL
jgi:hypothetical protein